MEVDRWKRKLASLWLLLFFKKEKEVDEPLLFIY